MMQIHVHMQHIIKSCISLYMKHRLVISGMYAKWRSSFFTVPKNVVALAACSKERAAVWRKVSRSFTTLEVRRTWKFKKRGNEIRNAPQSVAWYVCFSILSYKIELTRKEYVETEALFYHRLSSIVAGKASTFVYFQRFRDCRFQSATFDRWKGNSELQCWKFGVSLCAKWANHDTGLTSIRFPWCWPLATEISRELMEADDGSAWIPWLWQWRPIRTSLAIMSIQLYTPKN